MATGVGRGRICLASFNSPTRKPPVRRKVLADMSHTSRAIADFVPNFVAMVTGVGRGRICLASLNSPTPKTPVIHKDLADTSYISRVIADFVRYAYSQCNCIGYDFGEFGGNIVGCAIFQQGTPSGRRGASCELITTTIGQRASILQCLDRPVENALGLVKFGENWGKIGEGITGF